MTRAIDANVYVDEHGRRYVKVREVGYEEYVYIKDNGRLGVCGGFVGPEAGWKTISPDVQTNEDQRFRCEVEAAPAEDYKRMLGAARGERLMKSTIKQVPPSDVFLSDTEWDRVLFDHEELLQAVEEDGLTSLVREVLRPRYGGLVVFFAVVADVAHTVRQQLVKRMRSGEPVTHWNLTVTVNFTAAGAIERQAQERLERSQSMTYWRKE